MYRGIQMNGWKISVKNPNFYFQRMKTNSYSEYKHWGDVTNVIINA